MSFGIVQKAIFFETFALAGNDLRAKQEILQKKY